MIKNKIDVDVTPETEAQVIQDIKNGRALLDFLVGLSKKEKRGMAKLGAPYVEFTNRVRGHASKFPGYLPQQVSLEMFLRDNNTNESLRRIMAEVKTFESDLEDTMLVLKSEIYQTSRLYYNAVKAAGRSGDKDADRIASDLSAHYKKKPTTGETDETDNTTGNTTAVNTPVQSD